MRTPDYRSFREAVDAIPDRRYRTLIKRIYLTAARVSEVITKVTPYEEGHGATHPYGRYLDWSLVDYESEGVREKALLVQMAVAKRRRKREGKERQAYKMVVLPTSLCYEP